MEKQPRTREEYLKSALEEIPTNNLIDIAKHEISTLPDNDPRLIGKTCDLLLILDILEKRLNER